MVTVETLFLVIGVVHVSTDRSRAGPHSALGSASNSDPEVLGSIPGSAKLMS